MTYLKDSIRTTLVQFFLLAGGMAGGIINARWLGSGGVGVYVLLGLIPTMSFRFGNLGFGSAFSYFLAKQQIRVDWALATLWRLSLGLSSLCCLTLFAISGSRLLPWYDLPVPLILGGLALVPLAFLQNFAQRILAGRLKILNVNTSDLIGNILYLASLAILVISLDAGIPGALGALLISRIAVVSYLLRCIYQEREHPPEPELEPRSSMGLANMWQYGRWNYLIMLNRFLLDWFPVIVLKTVGSNETVGLYSVARTIADKMQTVPNSFSSIIFPYTSGASEDEARQRTNAVTRCFVLIMCAAAIALIVLSEFLITTLYGPAFRESAQVILYLLPTIVFFPLYKFQNTHLAASGHSRIASAPSLLSLPVLVALSVTLIPTRGLTGIAISLSATYTFLTLANLLLYRKYTASRVGEMLLLNHSDLQQIYRLLAKLRARLC